MYFVRSRVLPPGAPSQRPVRSGGVAAGPGAFDCPATEEVPIADATATAHTEPRRTLLVLMLVCSLIRGSVANLFPVCEDHRVAVDVGPSGFRAETLHCHLVTNLQRILPPAGPVETIRRAHFDGPV